MGSPLNGCSQAKHWVGGGGTLLWFFTVPSNVARRVPYRAIPSSSIRNALAVASRHPKFLVGVVLRPALVGAGDVRLDNFALRVPALFDPLVVYLAHAC